jgi:hypothetical protein
MRRKLIFLVVLVGSCGFVGYRFYQWVSFMEDLGECGFANGPCFGVKINLDLNNQIIDEYIDVPNGKIGFISVKESADTLAPIMFKLDRASRLQCAFRLESEFCSGIPLKEMSGMRLFHNREISIEFFNDTYSEPGSIYLTADYDFEYMCLSPM